jgi:hypothetical protein
MALIVANSENTFEGAIVTNGENKKYVYKVNKKSMYVGDSTYAEVMDKWENRAKGFTWKEMMTRLGGEMVNFGTWKISDEEASRKDGFEKINALKKLQKAPMSKKAENQMEILYKIYLKAESGMKGKTNYRFPSEIGSDRIIVVLFNKNRWSILNINGTLYFYDLNDKIYLLFNMKEHKNGKEVIWPIREYEKDEAISATA